MTNLTPPKFNFYSLVRALSLFALLFCCPKSVTAQVRGCTDPLSLNYNKDATINDGSCVYPLATTEATHSHTLSPSIKETSGLISWKGRLWTENDDRDTHLYVLSSADGAIKDSYDLPMAKNRDWEEISQDDNYVYVGDFGNNVSGNRTDLHILRIEKQSLLLRNPKIEVIAFSYDDQIDLSPQPINTTDFDCEAFFVTKEKIYLITKQWTGDKSGFYELSKTPGTHVAKRVHTLNVDGLTTGCVYLEDKHILTLCGYDHSLSPFVYLLYDFTADQFFDGNKRKIMIDLPLHQVEAITSTDGLNYFITNESFTAPQQIKTPQQLHTLDLTPYLGSYFNQKGLRLNHTKKAMIISVFPNPSSGKFQFTGIIEFETLDYQLIDIYGKTLIYGKLNALDKSLDLSGFAAGIYFLKLKGASQETFKLIKR